MPGWATSGGSVDIRAQVGLPRVDEEGLSGPAAAVVPTAPPTRRQVRQEEPECLEGGCGREHRIIP
eukprot:13081439-Alexandrium_andersonii.AAC.1